MNEWVFNVGTPNRIHTDQGRYFQAEVPRDLYALLKIKKSKTYRNQGNRQCERINRSIMKLLRTLLSDDKKKWSMHIAKLVHVFKGTPHIPTG